MKPVELLAVPPGVVTEIGPFVAPLGTVADICLAVSTLKEAAAVVLNFTKVAPAKFEPAILTLAPTGALVGEKLETDGKAPKVVAEASFEKGESPLLLLA
jgi:hypothetical protein